ncbi:hemojuvelin [Aulostomus maculatus]
MEHQTALLWQHFILLILLLAQLSIPTVSASCRILRCNSDFVAATLDLGSSSGAAGGFAVSGEVLNAGYCSALRSYATCTRRTARACRGDLAYHSAVQGIEDLLIQHRCPRAGPTTQPRPLPQGKLTGDTCQYERDVLTQEGRSPEYLHCGVFGDPHIRTFNNDFQTCSMQGAWPLVDNQFLYIQVTSLPKNSQTNITTITKITIIFKSWRHCIDQQLYQAELENVPAAFADGSTASGERRGHYSLLVRTQSPGRHAEIWAAHIATVLVVRQSSRSLALSLHLPRSIMEAYGPEQDLQLCVWGCPASQRLSTLHPPSGYSPATAAGAHAYCGALLPTRDVYYQACVFDVITTGDLNASAAAVVALQDAQVLISDTDTLHLQPIATAHTHRAQLDPTLLLLCILGTLSRVKDGTPGPESRATSSRGPEPQRLPETTRVSQRDHQRPPEVPRDHQRFPGTSRRSQRPPELPRDHQSFPETTRGSQGPPDVPRDHQSFPETTRASQRPPEVPRDLQTFPETSRRSQRPASALSCCINTMHCGCLLFLLVGLWAELGAGRVLPWSTANKDLQSMTADLLVALLNHSSFQTGNSVVLPDLNCTDDTAPPEKTSKLMCRLSHYSMCAEQASPFCGHSTSLDDAITLNSDLLEQMGFQKGQSDCAPTLSPSVAPSSPTSDLSLLRASVRCVSCWIQQVVKLNHSLARSAVSQHDHRL